MKILYVKSNSYRNRKFQIQTIIYEDSGKKFVKKRALQDEAVEHIQKIIKNYKLLEAKIDKRVLKLAPIVSSTNDSVTFEYIEGESFWSRYRALKSKEDIKSFIDEYIELLYNSFESKPFESREVSNNIKEYFGDIDYSILNGKESFSEVSNIDFIFSNLIYTPNKEIYLIDYEWVFEGSLPIDFSIYRVFRYLDIPYRVESSEVYKKMEDFFISNYIQKDSFELYRQNYIKKDEDLKLNSNKSLIDELREENRVLKDEIDRLQRDIEGMLNSKRWRVFAPLDLYRQNSIAKTIYLKVKSNRYLRKLYHNLPLSNETKWKIRQFITTRKIQKSQDIWIKEDLLPKVDSFSKELPKVSIIIPYYNQHQYIWESVTSAYASYSGEIEVIVVNDGSSDIKSINALKEIKYLFSDIKIVNKENGGLSSARNCGIDIATGEYIQFLDADDTLAPGKIDYQILNAKLSKDTVLVCNYLTANEDFTQFYKTEETIKGNDLDLESFLFKWERGLSVPIHCGLFPSKIFDTIRFDRELSAKEDWLFWCSLLFRGYKIEYIDIYSVVYRVYNLSMVRKSFVKMAREWQKAYKKIAQELKGLEKSRFLKESQEWLNRYYYSNPNYKLELKSNKSDKIESLEVKKSINHNLLLNYIEDMNRDEPIFSIVIPVFNHYEYLYESIKSALTQKEAPPYEVICIDDASSDNKVAELLKALKDRNPNFKVILNKQNRGISTIQNEAVKMARGKYIAFLDCDDYLSDRALSIFYKEIKRKDYDYLFSDRVNIDEGGKTLYEARYFTVMSGDFKSDLLDRMVASHLKVIKRDSYLKAGGTSKELSGIQDWQLALKIAEFGEFKYIQKSLYYHRIHKASVTSSSIVAQLKKSNILRREFLQKWLRGSFDYKRYYETIYKKGIDYIYKLNCVEVFNTNNLKIDSWYAPKDLRSSFANSFTILDLRGEPSKVYIDFAREFNSYFDLIVCDRLSVATKIIGTLYSPSILLTPNKFNN